jgi:hypothetical protein
VSINRKTKAAPPQPLIHYWESAGDARLTPLGWLGGNDAPGIGGAERLEAFGINEVKLKRSCSIESDSVNFHQCQLTVVYL